MKKQIYIAPALLAASFMVLTSCSDEAYYLEGQGNVSIKASLSGEVKVVSRADADELRQLYGESLELWLTKPGQGPVRRYYGIADLPTAPVALPTGQYVAEAWAGDSVSASWDSKYFKAFMPFEVTKGTSTPLNVTLKIANVVVSVDVDESVDNVLKPDFTLTVGHDRGTLTFEGRDDRKGYFMMPSTSTDLTLTLEGQGLDGKAYTQTETIENAQGTTEYVIHITHNPKQTTEIGGGYFNITVDANEINVDERFELTLAPDISGIGFDIAQPLTFESGKGQRTSVYVSATDELTSLIIESADLASVLPEGRTSFDVVKAVDSSYEQALAAAGITFKRVMTDNVLTNIRVNFEENYVAALAEGTHRFTFNAADGSLTSAATITFDITNAPTVLLDAENVGYTSATFRANILKEQTSDQAGFRYRPAGQGSWKFIAGTIANGVMTASPADLSQNTTYEFSVLYNNFETSALTFTTLAYPQLPNAGFEFWSKPGKPWLVYGDGQSLFWDTGNHGSTTLSASASVTTPDETVKHSGKYSAKLASAFVGIGSIGKLAAGNIFTGKYLGTDGTDGILGWGQPFTAPARPKALKGYIKYTPVAVTHQQSNPGQMKKGDMDQGIIYIALMSDTPDPRENNEGFPVVIRTKNASQLFDKNASNVIAYGENVFTQATDGMIEFTINLEDVHPDLTMGRILVVASASRYGDYFTGGSGSTMWLDDLELIY